MFIHPSEMPVLSSVIFFIIGYLIIRCPNLSNEGAVIFVLILSLKTIYKLLLYNKICVPVWKYTHPLPNLSYN